jgi:hypothetical protein
LEVREDLARILDYALWVLDYLLGECDRDVYLGLDPRDPSQSKGRRKFVWKVACADAGLIFRGTGRRFVIKSFALCLQQSEVSLIFFFDAHRFDLVFRKVGLAPFRARDTWYMAHIVHYHRLTYKLRVSNLSINLLITSLINIL